MPYLHIGGDENEGKHWDANPQIQAFMKAQGVKDNARAAGATSTSALDDPHQAREADDGWDEILHPGPTESA